MKANRSSTNSFSTIGISKALKILRDVKGEFKLPILTDVHSTNEVDEAAEVADILQIPAFLCRQTELIKAAARTGKAVNIKKGQFMAPESMKEAAMKAEEAGGSKIMLTERGTTFGYHDLVVDYRSLIVMKNLGYPVVYDSTHSVQKPGAEGDSSGGSPEFIIPLARAAAAVGVDGIFLETHPEPNEALCDKHCQIKLNLLDTMIEQVIRVWKI
jgi:2-dehydro-3-deoxyphosphooctonate aldolase (KDO 8-P synthase)